MNLRQIEIFRSGIRLAIFEQPKNFYVFSGVSVDYLIGGQPLRKIALLKIVSGAKIRCDISCSFTRRDPKVSRPLGQFAKQWDFTLPRVPFPRCSVASSSHNLEGLGRALDRYRLFSGGKKNRRHPRSAVRIWVICLFTSDCATYIDVGLDAAAASRNTPDILDKETPDIKVPNPTFNIAAKETNYFLIELVRRLLETTSAS